VKEIMDFQSMECLVVVLGNFAAMKDLVKELVVIDGSDGVSSVGEWIDVVHDLGSCRFNAWRAAGVPGGDLWENLLLLALWYL